MRRIICVGNRYRAGDDAGPRVYDYLARRALPAGVELHDGGLGGLNLLGLVETARQTVFVDNVRGFGGAGEVVVLRASELQFEAGPAHDHTSGIGYLLRVLPHVCEGPLPDVSVVGIEGEADDRTVQQAAALALRQVALETDAAPAARATGGGTR
jgi:hydrogenase maturation protease